MFVVFSLFLMSFVVNTPTKIGDIPDQDVNPNTPYSSDIDVKGNFESTNGPIHIYPNNLPGWLSYSELPPFEEKFAKFVWGVKIIEHNDLVITCSQDGAAGSVKIFNSTGGLLKKLGTNCVCLFAALDILYFSDGASLSIYDISDPFNPVPASHDQGWNAGSELSSIWASDDESSVLIADDSAGFKLLKTSPTSIGTIQTVTGTFLSVKVIGNIAVVAGTEGIRCFDITDIDSATPSMIENTNCKITIAGGSNVVGINNELKQIVFEMTKSGKVNVMIADIADAIATPATGGSTILGNITNYGMKSVDAVGNYLYLGGDAASDFRIYDIKDPASPRLVSNFSIAGNVHGVVVKGNTLYPLEDGTEGGLHVMKFGKIRLNGTSPDDIPSGVTYPIEIKAVDNTGEISQTFNLVLKSMCTSSCQNGGVCNDTETCDCQNGYHGLHCEFEPVGVLHSSSTLASLGMIFLFLNLLLLG